MARRSRARRADRADERRSSNRGNHGRPSAKSSTPLFIPFSFPVGRRSRLVRRAASGSIRSARGAEQDVVWITTRGSSRARTRSSARHGGRGLPRGDAARVRVLLGDRRGRRHLHLGLVRVARAYRLSEVEAERQRRWRRSSRPRARASTSAASSRSRSLAGELLAHEVGDDARVGLALRLLHDLAHEEAEEAFLAAAVRGDLAGVLLEDPVDDRARARRCLTPPPARDRDRPRSPGRRAARSRRRTLHGGCGRAPRRASRAPAACTAVGSTPAPTRLFAITLAAATGLRPPRPSRPRADRDRP